MLQLKIKELGTNSEGSKLYLEDATGDYSAENEGGYGTPNPERLSLALVLVATFKNVQSGVTATVSEYDPLSVESFAIDLSQDGWLQANLYAVPVFDEDATYQEGDIVYDEGLKKNIGGVFEAVESDVLPESEIGTYQYNRLIPIKITNKLSEINKEIINAEDDDVFVDWQRRYDVVYGHLNGAKEYFCAKNYYESQKIIETAEDYYKTFC